MAKKTSEAIIAAANEETAPGVLSEPGETTSSVKLVAVASDRVKVAVVEEAAIGEIEELRARIVGLESRLAYLTNLFGWPKD